jgi:divalent metal cation (Fe/Co/Zn/Cd) transporter
VVAAAAGMSAGSAALSAFGFDSMIEVASAGILWRRLRRERRGREPAGEEVERRASRLAGALLLLLSAGIAIESARQLATGFRPSGSRVGILLTLLALIVMPIVARAKLSAAAALRSRALRADAHETIACAWMSVTTLLGVALNTAFGWWWADPAAALLLIPRISREGWEAWRMKPEEGRED